LYLTVVSFATSVACSFFTTFYQLGTEAPIFFPHLLHNLSDTDILRQSLLGLSMFYLDISEAEHEIQFDILFDFQSKIVQS